jgi:hypothetical protein
MICDNKEQKIGAKKIEHIFSHTTDLDYVTLETKSTVVLQNIVGRWVYELEYVRVV